MIIDIDELVAKLERGSNRNDTSPSEALWIRFSHEKTRNTVEYRSADGNKIAHVYLDENDALIGIEIFP